MISNEIIDELNSSDELPVEALKKAGQQCDILTPLFLGEIEKYLDLDLAQRMTAKVGAIFWSFHLLGEWQDKNAYRLMARLLHVGEEEAEYLFGGLFMESVHRIMASVFDGDPQPLYDVILNRKADRFIRARLFDVFPIIVREGLFSKEEAIAFLKDSYNQLEQDKTAHVWQGWIGGVALLGAEELAPFAKEIIEETTKNSDDLPFWDDVTIFEEVLSYSIINVGRDKEGSEHEYDFWTGTLECFLFWEKKAKEFKEWDKELSIGEDEIDDDMLLKQLIEESPPFDTNLYKYIGRNDICPCGSGKKFKKCCGG